jgi:hypothetical protein
MECNFLKIKYIGYNADQIKFVSKSKTIGIKWYTIGDIHEMSYLTMWQVKTLPGLSWDIKVAPSHVQGE